MMFNSMIHFSMLYIEDDVSSRNMSPVVLDITKSHNLENVETECPPTPSQVFNINSLTDFF